MDTPAPSQAGGSRSVEDILLASNAITVDQLTLAKTEAANTGAPIAEVLSNRGFVSENDLAQARATALDIPLAKLSTVEVSPELLNLIPQAVAEEYRSVPFNLDVGSNTLSVAMVDPLDLTAISFLERKTGKKVKPFLATAGDITTFIADKYNQVLSTEVSAALKETPLAEVQQDLAQTGAPGEIIRDAPVAKIATTILEFAVKSRASDVHLEPLEDKTRVRYRIDGILYEKLLLPKRIHESLVSRIKIMSDLKIDEKRIPQDGRFNFTADGTNVDVRVSTLPTVWGEKVVMRLLRKSGGVPTLADLGLRGLAMRNLETAILRPRGVILVVGPTGSGKTTTLYSVLSRINSTKVNVMTLEDPVEYQMPGVNQVQINPAAGLTFATGLRSFLRQDPNVILVGEIRDQETTDLAIQAALTGHLVFSTLHTNDAAGAIPRLLDLGAEPFLLTSSLNAVVGQRILRKICPTCKEPYNPPDLMANDIKTVLAKLLPAGSEKDGKLTLYRGKGCKECGDSGFLGRIGIFEVLPVSDKISQLILARDDALAVEKVAVEEGMITMKQDGYLKAVEGVTTIEEVLRVAQD